PRMRGGRAGNISDERERPGLEDTYSQSASREQRDERHEGMACREKQAAQGVERQSENDRDLAPGPVRQEAEQQRPRRDADHGRILKRPGGSEAQCEFFDDLWN